VRDVSLAIKYEDKFLLLSRVNLSKHLAHSNTREKEITPRRETLDPFLFKTISHSIVFLTVLLLMPRSSGFKER